jgi:O-antigen ligase/polysaccharide polymerase Wzy-like membrane protein
LGFRVLALPVIVLLGYATWLVGVAPWAERHAARGWLAYHDRYPCFSLETRPDQHSCEQLLASGREMPSLDHIKNEVVRGLRLQASYAMTKHDDRILYARRDFKLDQMGQRDRTWSAGVRIVAQHWAWGIGGSRQWAQYMQRLLGFPFTSPHNGVLEVAGGYGVLGLILYLSIIGMFVRNYWTLRKLVRKPWQRLVNESTFLCGVAVFLFETTDVLTVLAFSIHGIWFWAIAGVQAGLRNAVGEEERAVGRERVGANGISRSLQH